MGSVGRPLALAGQLTEREPATRTASSRALGRVLTRDRRAVVSATIILIIAFLAIAAPVLPIQSPDAMNLTNQLAPPSLEHLLGTDSFGRDILSRVIYGARISVAVGFVTVLMALVLGATSGILAGYFRGPIDSVLMRIMDTLLAFPSILLAIALVGVLGPGQFNVMLGLGIVYAPAFARVARAKVLSVRSREYVTAAQAVGASDARLLFRHIVPNSLGPIIVQATVAYAFAIIAEAGLSFLGLGVPPDVPSWGSMLTEARKYIQMDPWFALIPGTALSIAVLSITLLGDSLRETLDPSAK
ncbi:MAG TPA: ABC transporter permease [Thermomicrobiales bacterium]|nr:ABC transporter permease [Thermomicrobiales bacterium]